MVSRFASAPMVFLWFWFSCLDPAVSQAEDPIQFNRDIRPILSAACFRCHGLDANKRQADLRLDIPEAALATHDGRQAIKPGDPQQSEAWQRIISEDEGSVMPPKESNRQLTPEEKKIIQRWIEQGASYQNHWSFEPIRNVEPPAVDPRWPHWNREIDRFLIETMRVRGLEPQPIADKGTLLRRLSFTLTGLPPSLEELASFEADPSNEAYERMVDRYLKSARYGQEMAKHWLDVARYGDTHGLHLDNERQIWAYRDWVVDAFNRNLPFSDFTIEQLAGDLLPSPTADQWVATGFNRCNVTTSEGGAIDEEFLFRYAVDRASTTAEAWMGLTAGCAVCHDHKYDPLSMQDFYSLYAFFYSAADPAMDGNTDTTAPFYRRKTADTEAEIQNAERHLDNAKRSLVELSRAEMNDAPIDVSAPPQGSNSAAVHDVWIDDDLPLASSHRNTSRNAERWSDPNELQVPMGRRAIFQAFGDKFEQTVSGGLIPRTIPASAKIQFWVRLDPYEPPKAIFIELKSDDRTERWVWATEVESARLVDAQAKQVVGALPKAGEWVRLERELVDWKAASEVKEIKFGQYGGKLHWDGLVCVGQSRAAEDIRVDFAKWWSSRKGKDTPEASGECNAILKAGPPAESVSSEEREKAEREAQHFYRAFVQADVDSRVLGARQAWNAARTQLAILQTRLPGSMIYRDLPQPRQAFIMKRGQYDQKGDEVQPGTPRFLPAMAIPSPEKASGRPSRLDLARWLVSEEQPLTARVTVNRFWQQVFGAGIVLTSEDFGSQGTPPTHPELLDRLAYRFRASGWNVKALMKEMVMSEAFRQQANCTEDGLRVDPANRWLARGPRMRLDAEQIRDNALAVSGLLNEKFGGPAVKVYQPANIWEPVGYADSNTRYYLQDHGDALYRRSLYVFIKRTAPPPFMSNFDAPNREMFCARRERSNTPLQALQLMNDVQHVEAARKLAERMTREGGLDDVSRIRFAFRVVLSRWPDEHELKISMETLRGFQRKFAAAPGNAEQVLQVGEAPMATSVPKTELAAYALFANMLLNLDETVNRN